MRSFWLSICVVVMSGFLTGCGRGPQFSPANRTVLRALQTAVTSSNTDWLAAVETQTEQKFGDKSLSNTEYQAVQTILKTAKAGDWKRAKKEVITLVDSQRATSAELSASRDRSRTAASVAN